VRFKTEQVDAFLNGHYGQPAESVQPLGAGEWSQAFAFRRAGKDYVVRLGTHGEDFTKDQQAAQFASSHLPIPRVLEVGEALGGYFAISERACGHMLDDLDAAGMRQIVPAVLQTLDAARAVNLSSSRGYGAWDASGVAPHPSWREYLLTVAHDARARRIHGWRARLENSRIGAGPFEAAYKRLAELSHVCPTDRHLVHSDLLNHNVLVADGRISAVIDWANSLYGDFLYDLAWFIFWSPWYPAMQDIDWQAEARRHYATIGLMVPNFAERLRCYQIHIGLDAQAYNAFIGRQVQLEINARNTLKIAQG